MSAAALSSAQFGTSTNAHQTLGDSASPASTPVEHPQYQVAPPSIPLPYSAQTDSTAKQAVAWRQPSPVLPLGAATAGTLFNPSEVNND